MTTNTSRRIAVLERLQDDARPLVVFGTPTPEQHEAIAQAERVGRPVIRWPVCVPRIESDLAERKQP